MVGTVGSTSATSGANAPTAAAGDKFGFAIGAGLRINLDMLARGPLWKDGLNYLHGTGHGIGAFLNVHEGPFSVGGGAVHANKIQETARMRRMFLAPIEEGYHLSDEPGFCQEGSFGIRLEADLVARETAAEPGRRRVRQRVGPPEALAAVRRIEDVPVAEETRVRLEVPQGVVEDRHAPGQHDGVVF